MYSFNKKTNTVKNQLTDSCGEVADTTKIYKTAGFGIVVFGIENYGQNLSNESAIIESHDLGVRAVIVKSFTRIHETNLKKQGMLALTFVNPSDYDLIQEDDRVSILSLADFTPGQPLMLEALHSDGSKDVFPVHHTYNEAQIQWFKAGSALNEIRANQ